MQDISHAGDRWTSANQHRTVVTGVRLAIYFHGRTNAKLPELLFGKPCSLKQGKHERSGSISRGRAKLSLGNLLFFGEHGNAHVQLLLRLAGALELQQQTPIDLLQSWHMLASGSKSFSTLQPDPMAYMTAVQRMGAFSQTQN